MSLYRTARGSRGKGLLLYLLAQWLGYSPGRWEKGFEQGSATCQVNALIMGLWDFSGAGGFNQNNLVTLCKFIKCFDVAESAFFTKTNLG